MYEKRKKDPKRIEYNKKYRQRPYVKKRDLEYSRAPENRIRQKLYMRKWRSLNPSKNLEYKYKSYLEMGGSKHKYSHSLRFWSKLIRVNDNNQCVICGSTNRLHAHHLLYRRYFVNLSLNKNNGVTLCEEHHKEAHLLDNINT